MDHDWDSVAGDLGPRLFRYFSARFSYEQSRDLTQETLIRLVQKTRDGHFDPARGNLRMLAYGIAHFVALEADRRPRPAESPSDLQSESPRPDEQIIHTQRSKQMREALQRLDPVQMQIISLMIDEEMTLTDIGVVLGLPTGTVKSHVHRAKENLRKILLTKESI